MAFYDAINDSGVVKTVNEDTTFQIRSKVWIEDNEGTVIFGLGRLKILDAIDRCGSLNAAAKELKMSYRGLWGKIKATEEGLGKTLLKKKAGGASGGGSELTPIARNLINEFRKLHGHVNWESDLFFDTIFAETLETK